MAAAALVDWLQPDYVERACQLWLRVAADTRPASVYHETKWHTNAVLKARWQAAVACLFVTCKLALHGERCARAGGRRRRRRRRSVLRFAERRCYLAHAGPVVEVFRATCAAYQVHRPHARPWLTRAPPAGG